MNVFIREIKAHSKSLIFWCIGMALMIASGMAKFSYYVESGQSIQELMSRIPKTLRAILGMGDFDVTKASGFYGMLFLYLLVMATIHASMLGANIIAKEERDKTAEFLMTRPISRTDIITSKLLAALLNILILNLVTLILSVSLVNKYGHGENITGDILLLMGAMFILQLLFLSIGTAIASVSRNPKLSASIATTVLLITFMLSVVCDMNSSLEGLKYLTPFKYFEAAQVMYGGGLETLYVIISIVLITALTSVTYGFYKKRDLKL